MKVILYRVHGACNQRDCNLCQFSTQLQLFSFQQLFHSGVSVMTIDYHCEMFNQVQVYCSRHTSESVARPFFFPLKDSQSKKQPYLSQCCHGWTVNIFGKHNSVLCINLFWMCGLRCKMIQLLYKHLLFPTSNNCVTISQILFHQSEMLSSFTLLVITLDNTMFTSSPPPPPLVLDKQSLR